MSTKLFKLSGTEKQITWADAIRDVMLKFCAKNNLKKVEEIILQETEAKYFIDNWSIMTSKYKNDYAKFKSLMDFELELEILGDKIEKPIMKNGFYVNLEEAIENQKNIIANMKSSCQLTEEQIRTGYKLCEMEDLVYSESGGEQHARKKIFEEMGSLLDYDYKKVIAIEREKQILDIYEETYESEGICIVIEGELDICYAISSEKCTNRISISAYRFSSSYRFPSGQSIENIKWADLPNNIKNNDAIKKKLHIID